MLCDFSGKSLAVVPRKRVVIRVGVIDRGELCATRHYPNWRVPARPYSSLLDRSTSNAGWSAAEPVVRDQPEVLGGIALTVAAGVDVPVRCSR